MDIIGIDASLTGTCLYDGTTWLKISPSGKGAARMLEIRAAVRRFIEDYQAPIVFLEDFAFSRAQHAHEKGGLGWIIRMELIDRRIPVYLVKPNTRAMFATGRGNAGKSEVVSATSARTGIAFASDDHCDAFLLQCLGCEILGVEHEMGSMPRTHRRTLDKVTELV